MTFPGRNPVAARGSRTARIHRPRPSSPVRRSDGLRRTAASGPFLALAGACWVMLGAAPANGQVEVWSATLTPKSVRSSLGCDNDQTGLECSNSGILSDDDFTHASTDYTIVEILLDSEGALLVGFNRSVAGGNGLVLEVDGQFFAVADAEGAGALWLWRRTGLGWGENRTVPLRIVLTPAIPPAVWAATLSARDLGAGTLGCSNTRGRHCSDSNVLSDDNFTYASTDHSITFISFDPAEGEGSLVLIFYSFPVVQARRLYLEVNRTLFALADAERVGSSFKWVNTRLGLRQNDLVQLRLVVPLYLLGDA